MFKSLFKWFNLFIGLFRENKLLSSKVVNITLIVMALIYVIFISKAIFQNESENRQAPITIEKITLLDTKIRTDQMIFVILQGNLNTRHCETYVLGSVIDSSSNVLFDKITEMPIDQLDDALENRTPLKLNVGVLNPGIYKLRTEFHNICSGKSYIVLAPLVQFEVK